MTQQQVRQRNTRQRAAIADLLERSDGFRTAQDLHDELRRTGMRVGLTTVYRTLQSLADAGAVDVLRTAEGEAMYRRCESEGHHHHLVCRLCGLSVEIEGPEVERWAVTMAEEHGFTDATHTAELYGYCADCSRRRPKRRG